MMSSAVRQHSLCEVLPPGLDDKLAPPRLLPFLSSKAQAGLGGTGTGSAHTTLSAGTLISKSREPQNPGGRISILFPFHGLETGAQRALVSDRGWN